LGQKAAAKQEATKLANFSSNITAVGIAALAAGTMLQGLAKNLKETGDVSEETVKVVEGLGSGL
jgi:hypothetical protein